ncbi:radical SAM protein [Fibrobacter sp. UWP2]|uniref:radical SAM protein n=1 Tax=Fibrobacter sp. UWP2 TaxID=1896216 RepID=UPI00091450E5|nr:radical SAM protein [Fibrobacter sp. UWP2]SHI82082.1 Radical SAM superfamily enzyme, MoaA/NifB/PqqE/SkfB family [Fibrobacter sp. UWP2]
MPKLKNLDLEISNPCNEHCIHCYRTCEQTKRGFLSIDDVKEIFDAIKPIREEKINVLLTGGETLLNRDWRKILVHSMEENARVTLFTNGTLMSDKDVQFLAKFKNNPHFKEVQISLYSLQPEIHDAITGFKGSCEKSLKTISALKAAGIQVFVSSPVMKSNMMTIPALMRYMDNAEIGNCANLFIFENSDYEGVNIGHRLSVEDLEIFYAETSKNNFELGYVWGFSCKNGKDLNSLFYEYAASGVLISGDGSIYPMIGWYEKLGNIHKDSVENVFLNNPLLAKCRQIKIGDFKECRECDDIGYCSFCPISHLTANKGQLGKLSKDYCDYVHLIRQMAERRDAAKAEMKIG